VRGAVDPDNLVGEVFLQLARNIGRFQGDEDEFRSWAFMVAHHRLIDERRTRNRRPPETPIPDDFDVPAPDDVESQALTRLSSDRLRELFECLTPDQRDVLALRIIAGLDLEQTARIVDKRVGAVKALQHRAVQALRKKLASEGVTQ
jgi:RNA polymerase sigma-70 factor (ECF subfamily)